MGYSFKMQLPLLLCLSLFPAEAKLIVFLGHAELNSSWTIKDLDFDIILYQDTQLPRFFCGFVRFPGCQECPHRFLFSVFMMVGTNKPYVLWSPNRNKPVSANSTVKLDDSGNLALRDVDGRLVWQSNTAGLNVSGMQLQAGNLVLFTNESTTGTRRLVWESYTMPMDALLIGQPLGVGGRLISSVSATNISEGRFYLEVEHDRVSLKHISGQSYGEWCAVAEGVSFIRVEEGFLRCYDREGSIALSLHLANLYSYQTSNGLAPAGSAEPYEVDKFLLRLLPSGDLRAFFLYYSEEGISISRVFIYAPGPACGLTPGFCGSYGICTDRGECTCSLKNFSPVAANDLYQGCLLDGQQNHSCNSNNSLVEYVGLSSLLAWKSFTSGKGYKLTSKDECKTSCMSNCDCQGVIHESGRCFHMSEILTLWNLTFSYYNPVTYLKTTILTAGPGGSPARKKSRRTSQVLGVTLPVSVGSALFITIVFYLAMHAWRRPGKTTNTGKLGDFFPALLDSPKYYEYRELCQMTNNFTTQLGRGGFATVFKGILCDGTKVAVKRLETARQGLKQFEAEVRTIGSIHHRNLVRLQGFGADEPYYYLVYDFVENGSLDRWLFKQQTHPLTIALDIARGLEYLHGGCKQRVLHLDIKPQNILLDANFEAKICDFGVARLLDRESNQSFIKTTIRGTPGYMAPEWLHSRVTDKTDVYSFGLVLLELISGKKAVPVSNTLSTEDIVTVRIRDFVEMEELTEQVDPTLLLKQLDVEQVKQVTQVALLCVDGDPSQRPSMANALKMLEPLHLNNNQ